MLALGLLGGCATSQAPSARSDVASKPDAQHGPWQGRFSVKVWGQQVQAFSSNFELQGSPEQGQLELSSVLGYVLARMRWDGDGATLESTSNSPPGPRHFATLQEMAEKVLGVDIPAALLFAWVQGQQVSDTDWTTDTSQWQDGRISAKRLSEPRADVLILLDR